MTVAAFIAGSACIAAALGYGVRFVLLKPEATAWPEANVMVRAVLILLASLSTFIGLQILSGGSCVSGALSAFMAVHGGYSVVMAVNLLGQRQVSWLHLPGLMRSREPTNAAG